MIETNNLIKCGSLILLMVQNVSLVLLMRFVRTRSGDMFSSSSAVVCSEIIKLATCLIILIFQFNCKMSQFLEHIKTNIFKDSRDWLLIAVPAVLYVCQNNLLFVAVSNLDAATFQVCYQLKLLTTALFFRLILKKSQSVVQWLSLFLLFGGIVIVQLQQVEEQQTSVEQNRFTGFTAVVVASFMSGFSGIFFEKILKTTDKDVWIRNIQLAVYGILFGIVTMFIYEGDAIVGRGFFLGYDVWVWVVVGTQSLGGLLVAIVVKYADNIFKGFATSAAIVLAAIISVPLFQFSPNMLFIVATTMVIVSTIVYPFFPHQGVVPEEDNTSDIRIRLVSK